MAWLDGMLWCGSVVSMNANPLVIFLLISILYYGFQKIKGD